MVHTEKVAKRSNRSDGFAALLLSGVACFQFALAAGAPWGAAAWGGANPGVLPRGLRVSSAGSGLVYLLLAVVARSSTLLPALLRRRILTVASGGMVVGTVMNLASPSKMERTLWTPVAATLAAVLWLAKERPGHPLIVIIAHGSRDKASLALMSPNSKGPLTTSTSRPRRPARGCVHVVDTDADLVVSRAGQAGVNVGEPLLVGRVPRLCRRSPHGATQSVR